MNSIPNRLNPELLTSAMLAAEGGIYKTYTYSALLEINDFSDMVCVLFL